MAQTAASGNSASESSWETVSDISSPAHSTGGSQLARLPALPARDRKRTADAGLDIAVGNTFDDTTRGEAAAVIAKRKADAGAAEEGPASKRRGGGGQAASTTSAKNMPSWTEGSTSEDRPFSSRNESSDAGGPSDGEPDPQDLLVAFDAKVDALEAAEASGVAGWAMLPAAADLIARAAAPAAMPAAGPTRQLAGGKAEGLQLPLLQTQPQLISAAPEAAAAAAAAAALAKAEQATVCGSSGVGSTALKRAAQQPLPGGLSAPTATQGPLQVHSEGQLALLRAQNAALQEQARLPKEESLAAESAAPAAADVADLRQKLAQAQAQAQARAATAQAATLQRLLDSERVAMVGVWRLVEEKQAAAARHRFAARHCAAKEAAQQCAEADVRDARAKLASAKAELARKETAIFKAVQGVLDAAS